MTAYKQLCAELLRAMDEIEECEAVDWSLVKTKPLKMANQSMAEARAALAQPEPEGPTDEEVNAWADQQGFIRGHGDHPCGFWIDDGDVGALVRAALARWGRPEPIPVTESVPGPEDCDAEGRCWWFCPQCPGEYPYWVFAKEVYCAPTHWLPAHALTSTPFS